MQPGSPLFITTIHGTAQNQRQTHKDRIRIPERCIHRSTQAKTQYDHQQWNGKNPFFPLHQQIKQTTQCRDPDMKTNTVEGFKEDHMSAEAKIKPEQDCDQIVSTRLVDAVGVVYDSF